MEQVEIEWPWLSISRATDFIWKRLFTRSGGMAALVLAACLGYWVSPPISFLDYLGIPVIALFTLFFFSLIFIFLGAAGDVFADVAMSKFFRTPDPRRWQHQALHLLFSLVGFLLATIVVSCTRYR